MFFMKSTIPLVMLVLRFRALGFEALGFKGFSV